MTARKVGSEQVVFNALLPKGYNEAIEMRCKTMGWTKTTLLERALGRECVEELAELGIHPDLRDR